MWALHLALLSALWWEHHSEQGLGGESKYLLQTSRDEPCRNNIFPLENLLFEEVSLWGREKNIIIIMIMIIIIANIWWVLALCQTPYF